MVGEELSFSFDMTFLNCIPERMSAAFWKARSEGRENNDTRWGAVLRVHSNSAFDVEPTFSPDGSRIHTNLIATNFLRKTADEISISLQICGTIGGAYLYRAHKAAVFGEGRGALFTVLIFSTVTGAANSPAQPKNICAALSALPKLVRDHVATIRRKRVVGRVLPMGRLSKQMA